MLKAMLWKEWRETRLLFYIMAFLAPCTSIFLNNNDIKPVYILLGVFFTVLMGATQFAGEEESGTFIFLLSRPIHWFKIWLFKVLYGIAIIILFGLFIFLMSRIFISSSIGSNFWVKPFLYHIPDILSGMCFLALYFISCTVSINIKSSLKATLATLVIVLLFSFIIFLSFSAIYFNEKQYLFLSIFPILFFIIFIKYIPETPFMKIAYWLLAIGTILLWGSTALKGGSLFLLLMTNNIYNDYFINPLIFLLEYVFPAGCFAAAVITSIFATGMFRKAYPAWWKFLSSLNFIIIVTYCFSAFLIFIIPTSPGIDSGFIGRYTLSDLSGFNQFNTYYELRSDNSNSTYVINNNLIFRRKPSLKDTLVWTCVRFSEKHFALDRENGKISFFGREKITGKDLLNVSSDQRWVIYSCPTLKWGVYYNIGVWAENLDSAEQYFLLDSDFINVHAGKWFDGGNRFLLMKNKRVAQKQTLFLFSVENGKPRLIKKIETSDRTYLIHVDKKKRLYFYDFGSRTVSCYNSDLVKEYDKFIPLHLPPGTFRFSQKNGDVYAGFPFISPGGNFMIYSLHGYSRSRNSENKELLRNTLNQTWYESFPNGEAKEINDINLINNAYGLELLESIPWHPVADNLLADARVTESGYQELRLFDLEKGKYITLLKEINEAGPGNLYFEWSRNGNYFLTCFNSLDKRGMTVKLYTFDLKTQTCSIVSSKTSLQGPHIWSIDRSHVVFSSNGSKDIWILDLNKSRWSKIASPSTYYNILGISNRGEVYVRPSDETVIYRLSENTKEIILQVK